MIFPLRSILNKCHNIYVWETLDVINHKSLNETPYLETPNINNNNAGSPLHGDVKVPSFSRIPWLTLSFTNLQRIQFMSVTSRTPLCSSWVVLCNSPMTHNKVSWTERKEFLWIMSSPVNSCFSFQLENKISFLKLNDWAK